jgi:hypothetical protein
VITTGRTDELDRAGRLRRRVILADGVFLAVIGAVQVAFELLGYYAGAGPLGAVFDGSPYTIGWVENHGFAFLVGTLFLTVAVRDGRRFWHGFAAAVHVLLGGANLLFWSSFVYFDVVAMGVAATIAHAVFVMVQLGCLRSADRAVAR